MNGLAVGVLAVVYALGPTEVPSGRTVTCLSGSGWKCDGEAVSVPHTWNAVDACDGPGATVALPGYGNGKSAQGKDYLRKRAVYSRTLPPIRSGKRYFVKCEGVSVISEMSVNGRPVGRHVGAFTSFAFDVTSFLKTDGANSLEITADNRWTEITQPMSADYSVYGGIYRDVWLIETDPVCIDPVTDGADGVQVVADPKTGEVCVEISVLGGTNETRRLKVDDPKLWSPESPALYSLRVGIDQKGSKDAVDVRFGFRTFEFRDGLFFLNGRQRQLRGVCRHQDRAGKGWAVSRADEVEDIRLMKDMGVDALRTAHYPASQHIYDLCDEMGLVAWCEYPNVNRVTFSDEFEKGMLQQTREMVVQRRNHVSIAQWGLFNELYMGENWMYPRTAELLRQITAQRDLVRSLDPTRTTVGVMAESGVHVVNAVPQECGLNVYPKWYSPLDMREMLDYILAVSGRKTVAISEYGVGASVRQHGDPCVQPKSDGPWHSEEYQAYRLHDNLLQLQREPRVWGTYVWAMFDFGSDCRTEGDRHGINDKGLVTHDRKVKKDAYYLYQAAWTKTPVVHLVGQRMRECRGESITVMGFSNQGPVTLTVNGRVVGTQAPDEVMAVVWPNVRLEPGENRVEIRSGDCMSSAVWTRRAEREPGATESRPAREGERGPLVMTVSAPYVDGVNWWPSRVFTNATERIQQALDEVWKAGGGTVRIAKGCYPIRGLRMRSNTTLYLESGAVLSASRLSDDFVVMPEGPSWNDAIIQIVGEKDVAIIGEKGSVIDGNNGYNPKGEEAYRGVHGITAMSVTNLTLKGYAIQHVGNWAHRLSRVRNLVCEDLAVLAGHDGIHFQHSDHVKIRGCRIETGDDSIAGFDNSDVDIRRCVLSSACQIFRFAGRNVLIEDCIAKGPCKYVFRGSVTPQAKRDGVWDPDLVMGRHSTAAFFCYMSVKKSVPRETPGNIVIRNCRAENCARLLRYNFTKEPWQEEVPLADIRFENVEASGLWLPMAAYGGDSTKYAPGRLEMENCRLSFARPVEALIDGGNMRRIALKNVSVTGVNGVLFRTWDGDCALDCRNVTGVKAVVMRGNGDFECSPR